MTSGGGGALDEFLQPKSMLTPGIAGGLTMLITNSLVTQFGLPPSYTGLVLSFVFGVIVFQTPVKLSKVRISAFYVINSLIIFSVALGANHAGVGGAIILDKAASKEEADHNVATWSPGAPFFANWLDGTVNERQKLTADVEKRVDESQAAETLKALDVPLDRAQPAKETLTALLQGARTAGDVEVVKSALERSSKTSQDAALRDH